MSVGAAILLGLLVLLVVKYLSKKKHYRLPPGPKGLPILGNIFQLDKGSPHVTITEWSEKYGSVFMIQNVGKSTVVLNDYDTIYEAMVTKSNAFAGRIESFRTKLLFGFIENIGFSTFTPKWAFLKKSAMTALKMYGDNLENLELISLDLIGELVTELSEHTKTGPFDVYPAVHRCVTGIMASILYAHKLDSDKIQSLLESIEEGGTYLRPTGTAILLDLMPWLRFLPFEKLSKDIVRVASKTHQWFWEELVERKRKHEPGNRLCVVDALFDDQSKANPNHTNQPFIISDDDIYGINRTLIFAGTVTTSITTYCLIALLVNKPDLQKKMADDIIEKLGDRPPRLSDRRRLPYIEAVLYEVFRYSSIVPLGIPHTTMEDTNINGYDIPKDTGIFFNLWKLHHNPEYWEEPWEFRPERFLDEDGNVVSADHVSRKRLLAFGAGRRVCVGETLAKNRLFLLVASLLQHFEFLPAGDEPRPKHDCRDYKSTFGIQPEPYKVKLANRKQQ